jgi:hypothetical protein
MSDKIPDALMGIGLTDMLSASSGKDPYTYRMAPTPSFTAGVNKYGKHISNEDALNEDEKRRNAEINAKIAAKKAARKGR